MGMVINDLADAIRTEMLFPAPTSQQLIGWSHAVIQHITSLGIVNHAPGLVTGTAPSPGPGALSNGAADNGLITGLSGSVLAPLVVQYAYSIYGPGYAYVTPPLLIICTEICNHIMTLGRVQFASGNIIGFCTNTALSPGSYTGTGRDGFIKLLNGPVLAAAIHAALASVNPCYSVPLPTRLIEFCTALVNYIMAHAVVTHTSCSGTAPLGGGPISAGTGVGGTIL